jgi:hypothetical protein
MTDDKLKQWWPDLGAVVIELRRSDQSTVADQLVDAVCAGATSSEIYGGVGRVLKNHYALHSQLSDSTQKAWDAVMVKVFRAFPDVWLSYWFARLKNCSRRCMLHGSARG